MTLRSIAAGTPGWEEHFGRLRAWATEHGSAAVPQLATVADGRGGTFGLGAWCTTQRMLRRRQLLGPERVSALEALPGWTWDPVPEQWLANLDALADWARRHGHANCPQTTVWRGRRIGVWVNTVRTAHKAGFVDAGRVAALEAVPGWSWDVRGDAWEEHFADLARWAAGHGHACPSSGDLVDGFDIGRWVAKQRSALRSGRLEAARAGRLRALPGWVDHEREAGWEAGYARLRSWAAEHGHAAPPQSLVLDDGYGLGAWVATQRERRRQGRLPDTRRDRLDVLGGWEWSPRNDAWPAAYARLVAFVECHGHARVPDGTDADGFCLGAWATAQRSHQRRGALSAERVAALEALPGWVWSAHGARFDAAVVALEAFATHHGHCEPGPDQGEEGRRLAGWVGRARARYGEGRLESVRAERLEAIAGWRWDAPRDRKAAWAAAWEANLAAVVRWASARGGALPRQGDVDDDGVRIGGWVAKQRSKHRAGRLGADRASRLEALPGWTW